MGFFNRTLISFFYKLTDKILFNYTNSTKDDLYVRLGDLNNEYDDESEQEFDIEELIIHEEYSYRPSPRSDLALLKLKRKNGKCAQ